ncbi:hypothetical protein [Streptomyces sp. NPDC056844]|uniref:hypothetical protein n=1 Tax=unclassified Streptomyces TaxID=2593676 RepID=UPI0036B650E3
MSTARTTSTTGTAVIIADSRGPYLWTGGPEVLEPDKRTAWTWWPLNSLPEGTAAYTRTAIEGIRTGTTYTELGWDGWDTPVARRTR